MNSIVRFLITFLFIVLLFVVKTMAQAEATVLEVGKPVERLLKAGKRILTKSMPPPISICMLRLMSFILIFRLHYFHPTEKNLLR